MIQEQIQQNRKPKNKELSNASTRLIVAVLTIPAVLAASYFGKLYFLFFAGGIGLISLYEFARFAQNKGINVNLIPAWISVLVLCINAYFQLLDPFKIIITIIFLISLVELFRNNGSAILNISGTLLGILYMGLFSSMLILIREFYPRVGELYLRGGLIIISVFASIWICDSAAYYGGTALGKHKLFPRVSPKKSWEGSIFGFVFAVLTMAGAKFILLDFLSWQSIIIIGVIVGTIGQLGDLVESLMKRDAGVKDSSNMIPGHGGVFDRFDSLLLTAPVIYLYLSYMDR